MALLLLLAVPASFVVALDYVAAQMLLTGAPEVSALTGSQRDALGMLFLRLHTDGVLAVEIFWGLWLLPFGLLVMRSHFLPRVLGILLIIAGVAYVAHSVTSLPLAGHRIILYERVTMPGASCRGVSDNVLVTDQGRRRAAGDLEGRLTNAAADNHFSDAASAQWW